jgi:histidine decarboxylase
MTILNKNKDRIIKGAESPHDNYCMGYPGQGPYFTGFVMSSSAVPTKLGNKGSSVLDRINAFDMAEVNDTYLGQINMITVSSFCGPHGLLWGYDIARTGEFSINDELELSDINEFPNFEILSGKNLRASTRELFGTRNNKKFPLFPGSHVFTAQKFISSPGPINLYGAFAVGIPENREKNACLFMEDIGHIKNESREEKRKILKNMICSIEAIGENQIVNYKTIYIDIITQKVGKNETGGVLVASPYFLLAKNAYISSTIPDTLKEWKNGK